MNKLELFTCGQPIFIATQGGAHTFTKAGTSLVEGQNIDSLIGKTVAYPFQLLLIPMRTTISICSN